MTTGQKAKYWSMWGEACTVRGWRMSSCRLVNPDQPVDDTGNQVWQAANILARQHHRAITPDDLRKGAHLAALGAPKSSLKLSNRELDRVYQVFSLLADECQLQGHIELAQREPDATDRWAASDPDDGERRRLEWAVEQWPAAYVQSICEDRFGSENWQALDIGYLRQLHMTLKHRKPVAKSAPKPIRPQPIPRKRISSAKPERELVYDAESVPF